MLARIAVYPVKSLAGVTVPEVVVEPWGLRHDRRWLVLNPDGSVLTARERHELLAITATPTHAGGIDLRGLDDSVIHVPSPSTGEPIATLLSRLDRVRSANSAANDWLSEQLGQRVRLGWLDDPRRRTVSESHGGRPGDPLSTADAGPLLLTTEASLRQLNDWISDAAAELDSPRPAPISMERFRPNVVVDGDLAPFVEDGWTRLRIGDVDFRLSEPCDRCVMTTIDPETLVAGKEPLRTLAKHRQWDHKTWFGVRLVPLTTGTLQIGDGVTVS